MVGLRVVIASGDGKTVKSLEEMVKMLGCVVVGRAYDEFSAIKTIRATQPDFIMLDGGLSFIETAKTVEEGMIAPMLVLTDRDCEHLGYINDTWEFDCIEKPVKIETLRIVIGICTEKYRKKLEILKESESIHSGKTTRNIVEKAKEILMRKMDISETQAFHRIQMLGHKKGITIRHMAEQIILNTRSKTNVPA